MGHFYDLLTFPFVNYFHQKNRVQHPPYSTKPFTTCYQPSSLPCQLFHHLLNRLNPLCPPGIAPAKQQRILQFSLSRVNQSAGNTIRRNRRLTLLQASVTPLRCNPSLCRSLQKRIYNGPPRHTHRTLRNHNIPFSCLNICPGKKQQSIPFVSGIPLSQRHTIAGTGVASVGKYMEMVLMYSPAVIANLQYHLWVFSSSYPLVAPYIYIFKSHAIASLPRLYTWLI